MHGQLDYELIEHQFYPTPPEYLDCLLHMIDVNGRVVWEPACGEGHLSKRLGALGIKVYSTDLIARGFGTGGINFLEARSTPRDVTDIITNPPYGDMAEPFVRHALELVKPVQGRVAMFLRNDWDTSGSDRPDLFEGHPAYACKVIVTKRPRWFEKKPGDKSPRFNFSWFVWDWAKPAGALPPVRYIHPKNAVPIKHALAA